MEYTVQINIQRKFLAGSGTFNSTEPYLVEFLHVIRELVLKAAGHLLLFNLDRNSRNSTTCSRNIIRAHFCTFLQKRKLGIDTGNIKLFNLNQGRVRHWVYINVLDFRIVKLGFQRINIRIINIDCNGTYLNSDL